MRTIAIVNQKGGCGKTMTAINLSAFLARTPRRVLLIDMDPQGHATLGVLKDSGPIDKTAYEVLAREQGVTSLRDVIIKTRENLDLVPSDVLLSALPEKLREMPRKEDRLAEALQEVRQDYDYVIIDCPPNVGLLTFNALKACSEAIIPVEPSFFCLHGIAKQLETLELLARKSSHDIQARALITLYSTRSDFGKTMAEEIRKHLGELCFNTLIRYSVKLPESAGQGLTIAEFSTRSAGFADYRALAQEILEQETSAESDLPPGMVASRPRLVEEGVLFTLDAPGAYCVRLAGDFNGWIADGNEMERCGGIWTKVIPLPPGRYQYRFVVDGRWFADPTNIDVEPAPWGGYNSVVNLEHDRT